MNITRERKVFLLIFLTYLFYNVPYVGVVESRYLDIAMSIAKKGVFNIDDYHYNTIDKSYFNRHYYSITAPGMTVFSLPSYLAFSSIWKLLPAEFTERDYNPLSHLRGVYKDVPLDFALNFHYKEFVYFHLFTDIFFIIPISMIFAFILFRMIKLFVEDEVVRLLVLVTFSLGTIIFHYSLRFWAHLPGTFFGFLSFYMLFMYKLKPKNNFYLFLAGFSSGMTVFIDYYLFIFCICSFFYMLTIKPRTENLFYYLLGHIPPLGALMAYQFICFENPLSISYMFNVHHHGIYGKGVLGVTYPQWKTIKGLLVSPQRGYFAYMPVLLLSVAGFFVKWKMKTESGDYSLKAEKTYCAAISLMFFLFIASRQFDWGGGGSFGPRYLTPTIPFMALSLCFAFSKINKIIATTLVSLSIFISWLGAQYGEAENITKYAFYIVSSGFNSSLRRFALMDNGSLAAINALFPLLAFFLLWSIIKKDSFRKATKYAHGAILAALFILAVSNYIIALDTMEKYYLIDVTHDLSKKNPSAEIPIPKAVYGRGLRIETSLGASVNVEQSSRIASITVTDENGKEYTCYILAGEDTAEWAWNRPDVKSVIKHREARVAIYQYNYAGRLRFYRANYAYYTTKMFKDFGAEKERIKPVKLTIKFVYSGEDKDKLLFNISKILLIE